jgi:fatty acid desaturase
LVQTLEAGTRADSIDELTVGAPRSAKEALESGAVSLQSLRELRDIKQSWAVRDLALTGAEIVAVPVLYMLFPNPLTFIICILWSIRNFNSCAQLVHETDHGALFRSPRLNNLAGNICAHIVGYTRYGHRAAHMDHHLYLNTDKDPDTIFSQPSATGRQILKGLLEDVFLTSAVKRFLQYFQSGDKKTRTISPWRNLTPAFFQHLAIALIPVAITQLVILSIYTVTAGPIYYFWFIIFPVLTIYPFQIRIRSIAEHSFDLDAAPTDTAWATRTSKLNWFEWLIIAPLYQNYHYEHHVFPTIPNHNLPKVHKMLVEAGIPVPTNTSYFGFVVRKIRADFARA